jgi:hypothetical protein
MNGHDAGIRVASLYQTEKITGQTRLWRHLKRCLAALGCLFMNYELRTSGRGNPRLIHTYTIVCEL